MLAQNFKSAADLAIREEHREALVKTLVLLETGKIIHRPKFDYSCPEHDDLPFTGHFNMEDWGAAADCGTVACIGGTAELVARLIPGELREAAGKNDPLWRLFYPDIDECDWHAIDTNQAACALRSYLTIGEPKWAEAVA